jgi:putative PIN family toxin of toxin-antitoxin system
LTGLPNRVVFDVQIYVHAAVVGNAPFRSWPSPPPTTGNPSADCLGIANDAREFSLFLSPHILENILRVLTDPFEGFAWESGVAAEYAEILVEIAVVSDGGVVSPTTHVNDCDDWEDNRILELALDCDAQLIASADSDLLDMSPWRTLPIIHPAEFASRVDVARRAGGR